MSEEKPLSKWEMSLTVALIFVVLGSTAYFIFRGWSNFRTEERKAWEAEKTAFNGESEILWDSLKKDLEGDPMLKPGENSLELIYNKKSDRVSVIYKFLPDPKVQGRIYRIRIDEKGLEEGVALLDNITEFNVKMEGNTFRVSAMRLPEKSKWKDAISVFAEFTTAGRESFISPGDINFHGGSGRKPPLFIEHPFVL